MPSVLIDPQSLLAPLQDALLVLAVVSKVTPQVISLAWKMTPLKFSAKNRWVAWVATVAVAGVIDMRRPESKLMLNLPVFFLSALEVAVIVTFTLGSLL